MGDLMLSDCVGICQSRSKRSCHYTCRSESEKPLTCPERFRLFQQLLGAFRDSVVILDCVEQGSLWTTCSVFFCRDFRNSRAHTGLEF